MIGPLPIRPLAVQLGPDDLSLPTLVALVGLEVLSVLLGLAIAYTAYRGYRRNDSRPMLYIAAGFLLVLGVPAALSAVVLGVGIPEVQLAVGLLTQVSEVGGLLAILYALRMRR